MDSHICLATISTLTVSPFVNFINIVSIFCNINITTTAVAFFTLLTYHYYSIKTGTENWVPSLDY